ncbi:MAG TPA: hypothetical protein VNJ08_06285 [Bacteriovoracaceae bacterium]|nr:hypothetical protein [Bacteriovoracaceae bacterium]
MNQETIYGITSVYGRNDGNAFNYSNTSTFSTEEDGEVTGHKYEKPDLNIHNSNSRLDKYLFYFSSKL